MSTDSSGGLITSQSISLKWVAVGGLLTAIAFPMQPIPMMPALALWPLIFVGPAPFLARLLCCQTVTQAAGTALVFALGWFLVAGVWVFRVFDGLGWVLIWIPIGYVVLFGTLAHILQRAGFGAWWTWPLLWMSIEFIRSEWTPLRFNWFSKDLDPLNFTWFVLGHPRLLWHPAAQSADIIGGYGLSFLPFMFNLAIATRLAGIKRGPPFRYVAFLLVVEVFYSAAALNRSSGEVGVKIGVVQSERFQLPVLMELTERLLVESPSTAIVVWPELSFSAAAEDRARLLEFARVNKVNLALGVEVATDDGGYRNLGWWLPADGEPAEYAKQQRVPFVEHHPRSVENKLISLPVGDQSITLAILICYDMDFANNPRQAAAAGAEMFLMPTLDETSWGGTQHSQHALLPRLRAIENRRPIAQAATSGVSQIVNHLGQVLAEIPFGLNKRPGRPTAYLEGVASHRIFTVNDLSIYTHFGYRIMPIIAGFATGLVIWSMLRVRTYRD